MLIKAQKDGDILTITPSEARLDVAVASEFRDHLFAHVDTGECRIVINLALVKFIDSSGLGALISGLKRLGNNGQLSISNPNEAVMSLFKMTRLDRVLDIIVDPAQIG